jgi:protease I
MTENLTGKRIAFLATDGYEDSELTSPWQAVTNAGAEAVLVSPATETIEGKNGTRSRSTSRSPTRTLRISTGSSCREASNADQLRMDRPSVAFAREFFAQHKPVGAICHAAWTLIEGDVVRDRTLTSHPSLTTDLRNAGDVGG